MRERIVTWARTLPQRHGGPVVVILFALVVTAGAAIRLNQAIDPQLATGSDQVAYTKIAQGLYRDGTYGLGDMPNPTDWSPGAPFMFAASWYLTGGERPLVARLVQVAVSVLTIFLIYLMGRRLAGPPRETRGAWGGLVAATFASFYVTFYRGPAKLLSEPLGTLMVTAAVLSFLWATEQRRPAAYILPGVLTGLAIFSRPDYLYLAPLFALLALLWVRQRRELGTGRGWVWPALATAGVVLGCVVVVLAPWTARNYHVLHRFVPVSTGSGKVLYVATLLPGEGRQVRAKQYLINFYCKRGVPQYCGRLWNQVPTTSILDHVANRHPGLDRDASLAKEGKANLRKYLREDPWGYLKMTLEKPVRMWLRPSRTTTRTKYTVYQKAYHGVVLLLGLIGMIVLAWRRRWEALVIGLTLGGATLLHMALVAVPRHNVPLMGMVMALAGAGAVWLYSLAAARWGRAAPAGAAPAQ